MIAVASTRALACATCSLDSAQEGQLVMIAAMLAIPCIAVIVGVVVVRRILRKFGERMAP